jgi:YVTN family beta-propeller protein
VGFNPDDLAVSPDGSQLWVTDTGPQTGPGSPTDIKVISTASNTATVTGAIQVGQLPWGLALSAKSSTLYVADPDSNQVSVVSTKTNTVTSTISLAGGPDTLGLTPNGSQLWVCGLTSAILTVVDTSNDSVVGSLNLGGDGANSGDGMDPADIVLTSTPTPGGS